MHTEIGLDTRMTFPKFWYVAEISTPKEALIGSRAVTPGRREQ